MTARRSALVVLLIAAAASALAAVAADAAEPQDAYSLPLQLWLDLIGLAWAASGAAIVVARPRHVLGWLIVAVGTLTQVSLAAEAVRRVGWVPETLVAHVLSFMAGTGIFLMLGLLPLLYPSGRLPSPRWRPLGIAITVGALALMTQWLMSRLLQWPWPFDEGSAPLVVWVPFTLYGAATVVGWIVTGRRIARARPPERQQLVLLLVAAALPLLASGLGESEPAQWVSATTLMLLPIAITVGILRYRMLGIELVLRRGLLYAGLTLCVVIVYAVLTWLGGRYLGGEQVPAVVAAALVAVGLLPVRDRLQRWVDLLVYGRRRERDQIISARAGERDRLRHDLHDGLGPSLTGMALGLQAVDDALAVGDARRAREIVAIIHSEIDRVVDEIRRILEDLRPAPLESTGLADALRLAFATQPAPPVIKIVSSEPRELPVEAEDAAYRIAIEAVHNAVRHARAGEVVVTIESNEQDMTVEVRDNGIGMPARSSEGVGLRSMRMRAAAVGGTLTIHSEHGTTVRLAVPVSARVST